MWKQSCSWCHTMNATWPGRECYCGQCGHRTDQPRCRCNCPQCIPCASNEAVFQVIEPPPATRIEGRGITCPEYEWQVTTDGVMLRVDDEANPELWFHVTINYAALVTLVNNVQLTRELAKLVSDATTPK
jgi:hypothetical protein